jgi:hypothetical protein
METYVHTFTSGDTLTPTKLNDARTATDIVNADISASAAIAATKLASDSITDTQIKSDAAIALSKLATGALPTGITVASANIVDGTVVNADVSASAAIAHTKLANITAGQVLLGNASNAPTATALTGDVTINSSGVTAIGSGVIVNADINASAAIALSKLATGALPTAITVASANLVDGTIVNADINASAAIAGTKIAPNFGNQNITTTGTLTAAAGSQITTDVGATATLELINTGSGTPTLNLTSIRGGVDVAGILNFNRYESGNAIVDINDVLGTMWFNGSDGTKLVAAANISSRCDGTPGVDDMPGRLMFSTTADGAATVTERMRIDSAGNVGINTTNPNAVAQLDVASTTRGFLPPRMTTAQRNAISTPPAGLMIYNTTTNKLNVRTASSWEAVTSS